MTHIVYIRPGREHYPLWFTNAQEEANEVAKRAGDPFWTWAWNRLNEHKIKLRDGVFQIHFSTEAEFTMFALKNS